MPESHTIFFATNRRHQGRNRWAPRDYSGRFSGDGAENLRVGKVEMEVDEAEVEHLLEADCGFGVGDGEALAKYLHECSESASIEAFEELLSKNESDTSQPEGNFGSSRLFRELREPALAHRDILIFVHGFNVSWWRAVASAMSLEFMLNHKSKSEIAVVLFTWPSNGRVIPYWSYFSDRSDARSSGAAVGRGFLKLRDFLVEELRRSRRAGEDPCKRSIHLLCHSMGNYVLQEALERTAEFSTGGRLPRIFDHVFLCAPDVADDVFERGEPLSGLPSMAENVTVYHNRGDLAMPVSDYTKGNSDRLGWRGANRPAELDGRVHVVDCSDIVTGFTEHGYHNSGHVAADIAQSLDHIKPDAPERDRIAVQHGWPNVWRLE